MLILIVSCLLTIQYDFELIFYQVFIGEFDLLRFLFFTLSSFMLNEFIIGKQLVKLYI